MIDSKQVFRIYFSHQIRGPRGNDATPEEINVNIDKHIAIGTEIIAYLLDWEKMDAYPKTDLYIPAKHDEFVQIAYNKKYLDEEQILDVDCDIINKCQLIIAFGDFTKSRGMKVEIEYAGEKEIPILFMPELNPDTIQTLKYTLQLLTES